MRKKISTLPPFETIKACAKYGEDFNSLYEGLDNLLSYRLDQDLRVLGIDKETAAELSTKVYEAKDIIEKNKL